MPIYLPKKIVPLTPTRESPLFFLAGPVRGGGGWQAYMAFNLLHRMPNAHIAIPTRWNDTHWMEKYFYQPFADADNRQLVWERHYLKQAGLEPGVHGCVIFWLGLESTTDPHPGPEPYAMDTRREVGKFTAFRQVLTMFQEELKGKLDWRVVVGGDSHFHGLDVILDELSDAAGERVPFYERMSQVVGQASLIAQQ